MTVRMVTGEGADVCPEGSYALYEHALCNTDPPGGPSGRPGGRVLIADEPIEDLAAYRFANAVSSVVNKTDRPLEILVGATVGVGQSLDRLPRGLDGCLAATRLDVPGGAGDEGPAGSTAASARRTTGAGAEAGTGAVTGAGTGAKAGAGERAALEQEPDCPSFFGSGRRIKYTLDDDPTRVETGVVMETRIDDSGCYLYVVFRDHAAAGPREDGSVIKVDHHHVLGPAGPPLG
ncbi:hypothetical protein [Streptomyces minutiscleroticus]|uniref:Uncharacterized protein n=1 Tax=Streptomyces minutiscleroticus TaxID=68238 RepID=A0A918U3X6_9ACTN|nr:hypothetical protein [Streptomyces minutiscleroticus]GGX88996.1 hypothetical protein GCM10010358_48810 [Streptomyces minutiscleroticus]